MITFDEGNLRFVYRVVGVAFDKGRILLQKATSQDFGALPGGRGELLEPAQQTLKREMVEELGTKVKVGRLLWVAENFFSGNDFITGERKDCHELVSRLGNKFNYLSLSPCGRDESEGSKSYHPHLIPLPSRERKLFKVFTRLHTRAIFSDGVAKGFTFA